jgi:hypothetical protein
MQTFMSCDHGLYSACGAEVTAGGFNFLCLRKGTHLYRALPKMSAADWIKFYEGKADPFPSWFGSVNVAGMYRRLYYDGGGTVLQFELTRDALLFRFTDSANVNKLLCEMTNVCHPNASPNQILEALRFATGIGMTCKQQAAYIRKLEMEYKYPLTLNKPRNKTSFKRCSLLEVDREVTANLCSFLKAYGCDGYVGDETFTGFGPFQGSFHEEIALCYAPALVRVIGEV